MKLNMCVYMYHRYSCYCTCIIYLNYIHTYILYLCTCHYYYRYPRTTTHLHHPSKFRAFCHHLHFWTHAIHIDFHTGDQFKR
jgi:hypothetical protein